jgi:hypothetical protein
MVVPAARAWRASAGRWTCVVPLGSRGAEVPPPAQLRSGPCRASALGRSGRAAADALWGPREPQPGPVYPNGGDDRAPAAARFRRGGLGGSQFGDRLGRAYSGVVPGWAPSEAPPERIAPQRTALPRRKNLAALRTRRSASWFREWLLGASRPKVSVEKVDARIVGPAGIR